MVVNNRVKYLLKNTGILGVCMFSSKLLVFFLVPVYTAVLTTAEYGIYDIAVTTMQLLYPVLTVNIAEAVMRFLMDKDIDKNVVIGYSFRIVLLAICIMSTLVICNVAFCLWMDIRNLEVYVLTYFATYILHNWLIQTAKGMEQVKCMGIAGLLGTIATLLLNVLFLLCFKVGLKGFFVANIFGELIPTLYIGVSLKVWRYLSYQRNEALQKTMLKYCIPMILVALGWWANSSVGRYIVTGFLGMSANGLFSVAYKVPTILTAVQQIFIQAWQVSAVKEYGNSESSEFYENIFLYLNLVMGIVCGILIVSNKFLASLLFSNEFYHACAYVPFLLLSTCFNAASGYIGAILIAQKNTKSITISAVVGIGANAVLCVALVLLMGVQGAAIATAFSSALVFIVRLKSISIGVFKGENWRIIPLWLILIISAVFEVFTESYGLTGICLLLVIMIFRKQLFGIAKMLSNAKHNK